MTKNLFFLVGGLFAFVTCTNSPTNSDNKNTIAQLKKDTLVPKTDTVKATNTAYNTNNWFNNVTAILSGNKGEANNLNYLFDTLAWAKHVVFIDSSWKRLEKKRLQVMKNWGRKEFEQLNAEATTVFYPFSGPDYITVNAFFPNADTYIMLGLESIGKLPDLQKFNNVDATDYEEDFKKSLSDIFDKSYFITQHMMGAFQAQKVNGLLPVLSFFIKKTGNELLDINYVVRYNQDSIGEVAYDYKTNDLKPFGVKINFLQEGKPKAVYYFKYDVSNKMFNDTTVFYKFIDKNTANCITYIKSASYLLHANFMANMRTLILKNSKVIVQDDTGIPYKYFEEGKKFNVKLYGQYVQPVKDFSYLKLQKELIEAFKRDSTSIKQLPFHLGYHWQSKKDVIMFAKRI
jgi:hypothetical protein